MIKRILTIFVSLLFSVQYSLAQDTFDIPVKGRLITGWQQADGTRIAALQLDLAPGWKTYWHTPGDSGIPPRIDWARSKNLDGISPLWPTPKVFHDNGLQSIGYKNQLILPLAIAPKRVGKAITIDARLDIGVCKDICIPHQMRITGVIDDANTKPTAAIVAALAARPFSASDAGAKPAKCDLHPTADGLEISVELKMPTTGGNEVVVIAPGRPGLWISSADSTRRGQSLSAVADIVATDGGGLGLNRSAIKITVIGKKHAVEFQGCTAG